MPPPLSRRISWLLILLTTAASCSDESGADRPDGAEGDVLDLDAAVDQGRTDPVDDALTDASDLDSATDRDGAEADLVDASDVDGSEAADALDLAIDGADAADDGPDPDAASPIFELFAEPLATGAPPLAAVTHPLSPSALWAETAAPLPTCAWWQNLTLDGGDQPINAYPYVLRALEGGLVVSRPQVAVAERSVSAFAGETLRLTAVSLPTTRQVIAWDDLSVTLAWSSGEEVMTVPIARGSPYVTALYEGLTPRLTSATPITSSEIGSDGRRVALTLADGTTWIAYSSASIAWTVGAAELVAGGPHDGWVRVALVGDGSDAESLLDTHASAIAMGGTVSATSRGDVATLVFDWDVSGDAPLLAMALPHHLETLTLTSATTIDPELTYATLRGPLTAVVGDVWTFEEPLSPIAWTAPAGIDPARRAAVEAALDDDGDLAPVATDPYFFGKQIAAVARLALIADELGREDLADALRGRLSSFLQPWAASTRADPVVYDQTWGGAVVDSGLDQPFNHFGQGYYNDHHFHWGYHIYAAAVLARDDPDWLATYRDYVLALVRDIANPSPADPYFTTFRSKDWYTGHSWASGLFALGLSRNQESTSEAVNAYYAVSLWGRVTDDRRLTDLGRLATALEIRATQSYWQIDDADGVYESPFADRGVVGILWDLRAEYAVFFGPNEEFMFGIQMLPYTPITEDLLEPAWVEAVDPLMSQILVRNDPPVSDGWRGFLIMARAVAEPNLAWLQAPALESFDDGNSRTNTLYWIATRP